jgi:WD40 repeat protein
LIFLGAIKCLCTISYDRIASGSNDKTIQIWDIGIHGYKCSKTLKGHTSNVNSLLLLSNNRLASSSSDWSIKIWCLNDLDLILTINGHTYAVNCLGILNDLIVSGSSDWSLKVWKEE